MLRIIIMLVMVLAPASVAFAGVSHRLTFRVQDLSFSQKHGYVKPRW